MQFCKVYAKMLRRYLYLVQISDSEILRHPPSCHCAIISSSHHERIIAIAAPQFFVIVEKAPNT